MSETDTEFMSRLQDEQAKRREEATQRFPDMVRLETEPGNLYRLHIQRAYGKQDDRYGDWMAFAFSDDSPVIKGYKGEANTLFTRSGVMRTIRGRILRGLDNNDQYKELVAGFSNGEPIVVNVPQIPEDGVKVQFALVEGEPKEGQSRGFIQAFGEVVEEFPSKWEGYDDFVGRIEKEYEEYRMARQESFSDEDDGKKIGHEQLVVNVPYHFHVDTVYAAKDASHMIIRLNKEKSELGGDLEKGEYGRAHLSGITLKSFLRILDCSPKGDTVLVQVGVQNNGEPEYAQVPFIPEGGQAVKFFRQEREGPNYTYKECLGDKL